MQNCLVTIDRLKHEHSATSQFTVHLQNSILRFRFIVLWKTKSLRLTHMKRKTCVNLIRSTYRRMQFESFTSYVVFTVTWCISYVQEIFSISNSTMRVVRFYLEPWQKGGTPSSSASLLLLSPKIRRRQRMFPRDDSNKDFLRRITSDEKDDEKKKTRRRSLTLRRVKSLASLCSDVLAENVSDYSESFLAQNFWRTSQTMHIKQNFL